jgi:hypothetical protein
MVDFVYTAVRMHNIIINIERVNKSVPVFYMIDNIELLYTLIIRSILPLRIFDET